MHAAFKLISDQSRSRIETTVEEYPEYEILLCVAPRGDYSLEQGAFI